MSKRVHTSDHYGGADAPYETIKVLKAWLTPQEYAGFLKGNAIKYLQRHRNKGKDVDLDKATQYTVWLADFAKELGHEVVYQDGVPAVLPIAEQGGKGEPLNLALLHLREMLETVAVALRSHANAGKHSTSHRGHLISLALAVEHMHKRINKHEIVT